MAEKYDRGEVLGQGNFAVVYQCIRKSDKRKVAMKRMKNQTSNVTIGVDFTGLREIKYLKTLVGSEFIIELLDVFLSNDVICMVLEFCPHNLESLIYDKTIFLKSHHQKCLLLMILSGVAFLHEKFILHRDLKPANILITSDGRVKIADFGLARYHSSPVKMTAETATLWYRAPELLFGSTFYSSGIDIWSVGCIFAEIILRTPLFPGESDVGQLAKIFNVLGTPSNDNWPNVSLLPNYIEFEIRTPMDLSSLGIAPTAMNLLLQMLTLYPIQRITASQALNSLYFTTLPNACPPNQLPLPKISNSEEENEELNNGVNPPLKKTKH